MPIFEMDIPCLVRAVVGVDISDMQNLICVVRVSYHIDSCSRCASKLKTWKIETTTNFRWKGLGGKPRRRLGTKSLQRIGRVVTAVASRNMQQHGF